MRAFQSTYIGRHDFPKSLPDFLLQQWFTLNDRDRRANRLKILWYSGDGLNLLCKRLDGGRFVWPQTTTGTVALTSAELSMLLEGIDWRRARRTTLAPIDPDRVVPTRAG
jgi:hypothetical protein